MNMNNDSLLKCNQDNNSSNTDIQHSKAHTISISNNLGDNSIIVRKKTTSTLSMDEKMLNDWNSGILNQDELVKKSNIEKEKEEKNNDAEEKKNCDRKGKKKISGLIINIKKTEKQLVEKTPFYQKQLMRKPTRSLSKDNKSPRLEFKNNPDLQRRVSEIYNQSKLQKNGAEFIAHQAEINGLIIKK